MEPSNRQLKEWAKRRDLREDFTNMAALRVGLTAWGRYWAFQELGRSYGNRSACDKLGDPVSRGGAVVHELNVPKHVAQYDLVIERLSINCKRAIRSQYVCKGQWALMGFDSKKSYIYWLRRAEMQLVK